MLLPKQTSPPLPPPPPIRKKSVGVLLILSTLLSRTLAAKLRHGGECLGVTGPRLLCTGSTWPPYPGLFLLVFFLSSLKGVRGNGSTYRRLRDRSQKLTVATYITVGKEEWVVAHAGLRHHTSVGFPSTVLAMLPLHLLRRVGQQTPFVS